MAILLALSSAVMWGLADFLGGTTTRRLKVLAVVGISQAFGLLVMVIFAGVTRAWVTAWDDTGWIVWAVVASISGFLGLATFYSALATGTMGIVAPIAALGVVVPLVAGILAGEQPGTIKVIGVGVALVGIVLASGPELSGGAPMRPVILALVSAVLLGTSLLGVARGSESNVTMTMLGMRVLTVSILVVVALSVRSVGGAQVSMLPILAVVGFFDVGANVAFGYASTLGLLSIVSVLGSLYPVTTVLLARFVHKERLRPVQIAGVAAALMGVALISGG
jgi:drug/metabolite transporter (DMT)-like permease